MALGKDLINSQFATKRGSDGGDFMMLWGTEKFQLWSLVRSTFPSLKGSGMGGWGTHTEDPSPRDTGLTFEATADTSS